MYLIFYFLKLFWNLKFPFKMYTIFFVSSLHYYIISYELILLSIWHVCSKSNWLLNWYLSSEMHWKVKPTITPSRSSRYLTFYLCNILHRLEKIQFFKFEDMLKTFTFHYFIIRIWKKIRKFKYFIYATGKSFIGSPMNK